MPAQRSCLTNRVSMLSQKLSIKSHKSMSFCFLLVAFGNYAAKHARALSMPSPLWQRKGCRMRGGGVLSGHERGREGGNGRGERGEEDEREVRDRGGAKEREGDRRGGERMSVLDHVAERMVCVRSESTKKRQ